MNMCLGYFAGEKNGEGDNPPIGIILSRNKDELLVECATCQMNSTLFVQKYQLYLPDRDALRHELDPESPLCWTCKSTRQLAAALEA